MANRIKSAGGIAVTLVSATMTAKAAARLSMLGGQDGWSSDRSA